MIKHITIIAGARPNFVKIAPIIHAILNKQQDGLDINYSLIHTGQHYDKKMSGDFFEQLEIPTPDLNLEAGGGTQAEQTALIMVRFEEYLTQNLTDLVLVVGDVTSTMACTIVARKLNVKVAHVEAGIRSRDLTMPEEINRKITDSISNFFFTTTKLANKNLIAEGVNKDKIFFVGNTMIDTLLKFKTKFKKPKVWDDLRLKEKKYLILTMHRPANVDQENKLKKFLNILIDSTHGLPIIFPVHPRTKKILQRLGFDSEKIKMIDPLSYLEFNFLVKSSFAVITDSGGITEETTVLGIPCFTIRDNTERPETVSIGTNEIIGTNPDNIKPYMKTLFEDNWKKGSIPELWDGNTATRIIEIISRF